MTSSSRHSKRLRSGSACFNSYSGCVNSRRPILQPLLQQHLLPHLSPHLPSHQPPHLQSWPTWHSGLGPCRRQRFCLSPSLSLKSLRPCLTARRTSRRSKQRWRVQCRKCTEQCIGRSRGRWWSPPAICATSQLRCGLGASREAPTRHAQHSKGRAHHLKVCHRRGHWHYPHCGAQRLARPSGSQPPLATAAVTFKSVPPYLEMGQAGICPLRRCCTRRTQHMSRSTPCGACA